MELKILQIKATQIIAALVLNQILMPFDTSKDQLLVWDAIHFKNILENGYQYEHSLAFMPGLSIFINILHGFIWYIPKIIIGLFFVNAMQIVAAVYLQKLGKILQMPGNFWILVLFTPQVYLLSSLYTEFPFAAFSFIGIFFIHNNEPIKATFLFTVASIFRSNGIINIGFLLWWSIRQYLLGSFKVKHFTILVCGSILIVFPFFLFQYYAYLLYCPGRPWCNAILSYGFVQKVYFNSGWFLYFTKPNLPLFLLVLPLQLLVLKYIPTVLNTHYKQFNVKQMLLNPITPHLVQLIFYMIYGTFAMHVNTLMRILSCCPGFYFVMQKAIQSKVGLYIYCVYFGITLITNIVFLPPA